MRTPRSLAAAVALALAAVALAACSSPPPSHQLVTDTPVPSTSSVAPTSGAAAPSTASPTAAADAVAATIRARYEAVRDGDYATACALYSKKFIRQFEQLAEAEGQGCVAAHRAGAANAATYLATAKKQHRAGLTPFFYVPSDIRIDESLISIEDDGTTAFEKPGTVTSLDPTKFEDGVGQLPSWIEGEDYLKLIDGHWTYIDMTEQ